MKKLLKLLLNLILLIIAVGFAIVLFPFGIVYAFLKLALQKNRSRIFENFADFVLIIAIAIDQLGNVVMGPLFNNILIKMSFQKEEKEYHPFGNSEQTISEVLGVNEYLLSLNALGRGIANILNMLDKNHTQKAVKAGAESRASLGVSVQKIRKMHFG